jgi:hypothetical protein
MTGLAGSGAALTSDAKLASDALLSRMLRGIWPSLPALLVASAAQCAAAAVPVLVAPGINPVAILVIALVVAPFTAALAATVNAMAIDGAVTIRTWWRGLRSGWAFGIRQALVPTVAAILFLAALHVWAGRRGWVLPSLAVTGAATLLTTAGLLAVLPLGVARPRLRGITLWITALHLVTRRPVRFLAALSVAGAGLWAAAAWTASLLLLVPAPATIVMVAAVWTSVEELLAESQPS